MKTDDSDTMGTWLDKEVHNELIGTRRTQTRHRCVFLHDDGKHYAFEYLRHDEYGIELDCEWEAVEVEEKEVLVKMWIPVNV